MPQRTFVDVNIKRRVEVLDPGALIGAVERSTAQRWTTFPAHSTCDVCVGRAGL